ncbi:NAD(P)H-binding protein [Sphingomonas sp. G-3-2-10]|uniref:NAD(P)H-binding protein n=1 Tax=Sphingomonas sp. G-3-2-10 TaxID=2728838 RepID=UPI00146ABA16|nr:NAD(P)H-binding protein [Sphingomonas sp. G-3-2-10]NML07674.1 NAD(P)H-binding protein [Sphingomonas sp. G-3-2-10]
MTRLLIAGATGLVGKLALERALADSRVTQVIAPTRRPIAPHEKLENVVVDFSDLPDSAAWWRVDGVICALGTTRAVAGSAAAFRAVDYDYPLAMARLARAHGATRFALTSSLGADPRSRLLYPRTKGELEVAVRQLDYPSLTILRPSVLGGLREPARAGERMAQIGFRILAPLLPRRLRVSPAGAVAACLIEAAIAGAPGVHVLHNQDMA